MQEVFRDGSLGKIKPYDENILKELLEKENIHHVNIFKLENKYEKKATIDLEYEDRQKMREDIRKLIQEELQRKDIMDTYNKLKQL